MGLRNWLIKTGHPEYWLPLPATVSWDVKHLFVSMQSLVATKLKTMSKDAQPVSKTKTSRTGERPHTSAFQLTQKHSYLKWLHGSNHSTAKQWRQWRNPHHHRPRVHQSGCFPALLYVRNQRRSHMTIHGKHLPMVRTPGQNHIR